MTGNPELLHEFPQLETERLLLRSPIREDSDFAFRHFSDKAVTQYLQDSPPLAERSEARDLIEQYLEPEGKTHNRWIIIRKTDQRPIGTCGFHRWEKRFSWAEIGYHLGKLCPWLVDSLTGVIRALEHGGTLPWTYEGTPYEKVINPDGVTTEYVRCLDPTESGIVVKVTRTALPE